MYALAHDAVSAAVVVDKQSACSQFYTVLNICEAIDTDEAVYISFHR